MDNLTYSEDVLKLNPELRDITVKKKSKYRNKPTFAVDRTFQSGGEAVRAGELMLLLKARQIFNLGFQVAFPLPGNTIYTADFVYLEFEDGKLMPVVEEFKGIWTRDARIKVRQFEEIYGIKVRIIK